VPSPVAPGEIVGILGRGIGPQNKVRAELTVAKTRIFFNSRRRCL
jgi:hypothetical protein